MSPRQPYASPAHLCEPQPGCTTASLIWLWVVGFTGVARARLRLVSLALSSPFLDNPCSPCMLHACVHHPPTHSFLLSAAVVGHVVTFDGYASIDFPCPLRPCILSVCLSVRVSLPACLLISSLLSVSVPAPPPSVCIETLRSSLCLWLALVAVVLSYVLHFSFVISLPP